jgi:hypothetical protein
LTSRLLGEVWERFEPAMLNSRDGEAQNEKTQ